MHMNLTSKLKRFDNSFCKTYRVDKNNNEKFNISVYEKQHIFHNVLKRNCHKIVNVIATQ